jgi:hypothetical protein
VEDRPRSFFEVSCFNALLFVLQPKMSATAPASGTAPTIDHNLYSRQLAVFGEAMGKLVQLDVLIIGMRGLGVEIG